MKTILNRYTLCLLLGAVYNHASLAVVDMKNANFSYSWVDISSDQLSGSTHLSVQRTYNSRSTFQGLFGKGWCSDFDERLAKSPDGTLLILKCGAGSVTRFRSEAETVNSVEEQIQAIVTKMIATNNLKMDQKQSLVEQLRQDAEMRNQLLARWGLTRVVPTQQRHVAEIIQDGWIVRSEEGFRWLKPDQTQRLYSNQGRLLEIRDQNALMTRFIWQGELLVEVKDSKRIALDLTYDQNKHLSLIKTANGATARYQIDQQGLLRSATNAWGNQYGYQYDENFKLTKALWPDNSSLELSYDEQRVASLKDRKNCLEKYHYDRDTLESAKHYSATVTNSCQDEYYESLFEFFTAQRLNGERYVKKIAMTQGNKTRISVFNEQFALPEQIQSNDETIYYEYFSNGLLKSKTGPNFREDYEYDYRISKPVRILRLVDYKDGLSSIPSYSANEYTASYDASGNAVILSDKMQIYQLTYDSRGRIDTITDSENKKLTLAYNQKLNKPVKLFMTDTGTLNIIYDELGNITSTNTNNSIKKEIDDISIAIKIGSFFESFYKLVNHFDTNSMNEVN